MCSKLFIIRVRLVENHVARLLNPKSHALFVINYCDLKHHVKKAHVSDDSGHKCNVCNGIFKNKLSLAEHSLKHQVKVVCEHCGDRLDESKIRMFECSV